MPTLPEGNGIDIQNVVFESQPDLTWWRDPDTNRIAGTADGHKAVAQAVEVMLLVERFRWQIYKPFFGMQWEGLLGQNPGYVAAELQRRIREAVAIDDRVTGISGFSYTLSGDTMTAQVTVNTVYGPLNQTVEVTLS
ncbi:MAG: DUF2634 domain-containing protein [Acutalibacter sp.]|jgi:hypothetical protein